MEWSGINRSALNAPAAAVTVVCVTVSRRHLGLVVTVQCGGRQSLLVGWLALKEAAAAAAAVAGGGGGSIVL